MNGRIIRDPNILGGKPIIKGTRISVDFILELLASGVSPKQILKEYPALKLSDIKSALLYAARVIKEEELVNV